jgi:hypothetical protein
MVTRPSAQEIAFRQAQANIGKPAAPVATARYVPSYASPAATARQTTQNLQAPGVPTATTGLSAPAPISSGGRSGNIPAQQAPAASAPAPAINWRDSAYNAQIAAIQRALQDFETGAQTRGERYGQDFTTGLQRLGYRPGEGFQAMPNILEALSARQMGADGAEGAMGVAVSPLGGSFDIEGVYDPYTAAAQGTRGLRDDFAGRGTLRSSDFARSFGEFQNRLNQQLEAMETGRTRFGQDLATDVSRERSATQDRLQAAQRDAMMRAAMGAAGMGGF